MVSSVKSDWPARMGVIFQALSATLLHHAVIRGTLPLRCHHVLVDLFRRLSPWDRTMADVIPLDSAALQFSMKQKYHKKLLSSNFLHNHSKSWTARAWKENCVTNLLQPSAITYQSLLAKIKSYLTNMFNSAYNYNSSPCWHQRTATLGSMNWGWRWGRMETFSCVWFSDLFTVCVRKSAGWYRLTE